jgi:hypothetical protein
VERQSSTHGGEATALLYNRTSQQLALTAILVAERWTGTGTGNASHHHLGGTRAGMRSLRLASRGG